MRYASAAPAAKSRPALRRPRARAVNAAACAALLVSAALSVALLLSRAELTALNDEGRGLAEEITELAEANARLTIEYESLYSLEEIERYAVEVLGMVPAGRAGPDSEYFAPGK